MAATMITRYLSVSFVTLCFVTAYTEKSIVILIDLRDKYHLPIYTVYFS